jgi:hypothetical protein
LNFSDLIYTRTMAKRTYLRFFLLVQFLTIVLIYGQLHEVRATSPISKIPFSPFSAAYIHEDVDYPCDEEDVLPTIQADELEWKENLNDLLLLRTTSYRFVVLEEPLSIFFSYQFDCKIIDFCRSIFAEYQRVITLPEYYKFLHRFCPF